MTASQDHASQPDEKKLTLLEKVGTSLFIFLYAALLVFYFVVLPYYFLTRYEHASDPEKRWGTESEAVQFAERQIRQHLKWTVDREVEWATGPEATMRKLEPMLDPNKRLWEVTGTVAIDENTTKNFRISCCKEEKWIPVQRIIDGRIEFNDSDVLKAPPDFLHDYVVEPMIR